MKDCHTPLSRSLGVNLCDNRRGKLSPCPCSAPAVDGHVQIGVELVRFYLARGVSVDLECPAGPYGISALRKPNPEEPRPHITQCS